MGTLSCRNIAAALLAICAATSWGVITMTTPASGSDCASVSCASPVPGGKSMSR